MLIIDSILAAQFKLRQHLTPTRLERAFTLGPSVWLKLENTNLTHSFKIRGALNAALSLDAGGALVTASSGNHAQGLAYAAHLTGATAKILMPAHTPQRKIDGVRYYGAEAITHFDNYDTAEAEALRLAREDGLTFVSPYNDPHIVAGTGTIALEILDQLPDVARVLVCVGGGGLVAGIATAIKARRPGCEVIGVCAQAAPSMYNSFYGTDHAEDWDTLAEALSGGIEPGAITVPLVKQHVDRVVLVSEVQIAEAMRWCVDVAGWLVEGGGAVGVAALLAGVVEADDRPTVVVVSGGNIAGETLRAVLRNE